MKIAHVVSYFQPEFGYEEFYSAREQAALGHEVHVITSDRIFPFNNVEKMLSDIGSEHSGRSRGVGVSEVEGVVVHRLKTRYEILYDLIRYDDIVSELASISPDVVHAHIPWAYGSRESARAKARLGYSLIIDEHGYSTTYDQKRTFRNWLLDKEYRFLRAPRARYALGKADGVVAVSEETEAFLREFYGQKKIDMIPLGVDHKRFRPDPEARERVRSELGIGDGLLLITAGRLDRAKRIGSLIKAVGKMGSTDVKMLVVGRGDDQYLDELKAMAGDNVIFQGFKTPEELSGLYNAADIGLWGKASITIREAMGCGLPIVLLDHPDMRSLLRWDNGLAVKDDPECIAGAVMGMDEDVRRHMGAKGRMVVESELSVNVQARRLLKVYSRVSLK
ncbi:MAG: glycosyltransferase family 4 protein [Thermoplasmata archaeon]|nr:glycosyltransferase family 4 protein [Thermoplasmata archaeon]